MAARRPVVIVSGKRQQLPAGDSLLGVAVRLPILLSGGVMSYIALDSNNALPILLSGGASSSIPVTLNG